MTNFRPTFRRAVAAIVAASMLTVLVPQAGKADWDDRSGELPGISGIKGAVILGAAIGGGLVLFSFFKKRGQYPLEVAEKLEFEATSDRKVVSVTNYGDETLTVSELKFDKAGYETSAAVPVRIQPGETFEIPVQRERNGDNKKAKLFLTALRAGGKSINRTVSIRAAS